MYKFNPDFYADVRIEDRFSSTIVFKNGTLDALNERTEKRAFIRVFDGNLWFYTSTSDIDSVQSELDALYNQATPNKNIADNPIVKRFQVNVAKEMKFENESIRDVSKDDKLALLKRLQEHIKSPFLAMSQAAYQDRNSVYRFYSSKGADIQYDYQMCGILAVGILAAPGDFVQAAYQQAKPFFSKLNLQTPTTLCKTQSLVKKANSPSFSRLWQQVCLLTSPSGIRAKQTLCSVTNTWQKSGCSAKRSAVISCQS